MEKYNSSAGNYQKIEGPAVARKILNESGFEIELIDRICFLVANHHTYDKVDYIDYQILIEADFLVNIFEDGFGKEKIILIKEKYFKNPWCKNQYGRHPYRDIFFNSAMPTYDTEKF